MTRQTAMNGSDNEGYIKFRQALRDGRLQAGMTVTQGELCELLDMSLSPLRETLVLLEEYGLVDIKPRAGIRIIYPDVAFIRENFQFRIMIEVHAIRVFAPQMRTAWLDDMRARHEEARKKLADDAPIETLRATLGALDHELHSSFVLSLDNRAVMRTYERLQQNLILARDVHQRVFQGRHFLASIDEHTKILDSLQRHDTEQAVLDLEAHFRGSTHRTFAAS